MLKCPKNPLLGTVCDYDSDRPPKGKGKSCHICWDIYNDRWGLPVGNRFSRSSPKISKSSWVNRKAFDLKPLFETKPSNISVALSREVESKNLKVISLGIDCSLTSTGYSLIFKGDLGEHYVVTGTVGFALDAKASYVHQIERLSLITNLLTDIFEAARVGRVKYPVSIEDHAYSRSSNKLATTHELHGFIKSAFRENYGVYVMPIGIEEVRKIVLNHGSPKVGDLNVKDSVKSVLSTKYPWVDSLNHDEIDAFAVSKARILKGEST